MTAQELFTLVVGNMGITSANAGSYVDTYIPQLNTILSQTFNLENNNRTALGLTLLTEIPTVTALSDTLTYQDNILRKVVVWGVAGLFALSDDDTLRAGFFEDRFASYQQSESKYISSDITDYFSLESDE